MTDAELEAADMWIDGGRWLSGRTGSEYTDTPDEVAAYVQSKIGVEPGRHSSWRKVGLDPVEMERKGEHLRQQLCAEQPEMGWRERRQAVWQMWDAISAPLDAAWKAKQAAARAAKKAAKAKLGQPHPKR